MWKRRNDQRGVRPWVAMVVAYALALQIIVSELVSGHFMAGADASGPNLFVICHGDNSSDDQGLPNNQPLAQPPCIFCMLAKAPCAILPPVDGNAVDNAVEISISNLRADNHVIEFHSPTGQYQRGPPLSISVLG